jgi:hypothetical protein
MDMTNVSLWLRGIGILAFVVTLGAGCETKNLDNEGSVTMSELQGQTPTAEELAEAGAGAEVVEVVEVVETADGTEEVITYSTTTGGETTTTGGWPSEITGSIKWLHTDVSSWPVTASLSAKVSGGTINMPYSKSKSWHAVGGLNANPWAIVNVGGQWYAGTFEYFRYGQTSKPVGVLDGSKGDHFKVSPLNKWRPSSGERFGIMISGLARSSSRNVKERSNVSMVTWP